MLRAVPADPYLLITSHPYPGAHAAFPSFQYVEGDRVTLFFRAGSSIGTGFYRGYLVGYDSSGAFVIRREDTTLYGGRWTPALEARIEAVVPDGGVGRITRIAAERAGASGPYALVHPTERWPFDASTTCVFEDDQLTLARSDVVWLARWNCSALGPPPAMFVHAFVADGSEPLGDGGVSLTHQVSPSPGYLNTTSSLAGAPDGGLWFLADREGGAGDGIVGLRAVHIALDGSVSTSPILVDPALAVRPAGESGTLAHCAWGRTAEDGAYLSQFVSVAADRDGWASYVQRVEPDGSLSWQVVTDQQTTLCAGPRLDDAMMDEYAGGVIGLLGRYDDRGRLRLWGVAADGTLVHGEQGATIAELDGTPTLTQVEVASDGAGGVLRRCRARSSRSSTTTPRRGLCGHLRKVSCLAHTAFRRTRRSGSVSQRTQEAGSGCSTTSHSTMTWGSNTSIRRGDRSGIAACISAAANQARCFDRTRPTSSG